MKQVAREGPGTVLDSTQSARTDEESTEHEKDDNCRVRELGQQIETRRQGGMHGSLWPIHKEQGTQMLKGYRSRRESSSQVKVG